MIRRAGAPLRQSRYAFRYCVQRGGTVFVGFSPRGDARLVMSAAPGHRARGVRRGTYVRRLRTIYRQAYRLRRGVLATTRSSRIIFVTRRGRVRFVAVADRRLIKKPRNLAVYLRRALR